MAATIINRHSLQSSIVARCGYRLTLHWDNRESL